VLIVDDVISAGTSVREAVEIIRAQGAEPCAVAIALDRMERGIGERSAVQEVEQTVGIPVISIATLEDLVDYLRGEPRGATLLDSVLAYRNRYGIASHAS
jgi:orotate phosphoribosyltransferase